jgi:hypothetical protein
MTAAGERSTRSLAWNCLGAVNLRKSPRSPRPYLINVLKNSEEVASVSAVRLRVVVAMPTDSGRLTQKSQHR